MKLCKLVIGVRPARRMFRITSVAGEIVDALIDAVGDRLPDDYFTRASRRTDGEFVQLKDEKGTHSLIVDSQNIIFTKDYYDSKARHDFEAAFNEFQQLWQACQTVLKVRNIRRVGMVGEYRLVPGTNVSAALLANLTKLQPRGHAAKFSLQFESHTLTTGGSGLPDVKTSDFWNTIETYYDSELDTDHPDEGEVTIMLDVQRYYTPLLNGNVVDEVRKLKRRYDDVVRQTKDRLTQLGLTHVGHETENAEQEA